MALPRSVITTFALLAAATVSVSSTVSASDHQSLQELLKQIAVSVEGRIGVCADDGETRACINGNRRFSLQSVSKLVVGIVVFDCVDRGSLRFDTPVVVHRGDLSLAVQPLAKLVTEAGFKTTIEDLVKRAVVDSDSAANDVLMARIGGPNAIRSALRRFGISGVRIDRDERHLQTESWGLQWRPEYVDASTLEEAYAAIPETTTDAAFRAYQRDHRDTATPAGMVALLGRLARGRLLSATSTAKLIDIMGQTRTFPDRLQAGIGPGWTLLHKTGTSGTWRGVTAATNDVGILRSPTGELVSVAVFVADSTAPAAARSAAIARVAEAIVRSRKTVE